MKGAMIVSILVIAASVVGCGGNPGRESTPPATETTRPPESTVPSTGLDGSQWKLVSINGTQPIAGSYVSLFFSGGTVWGHSGVNSYGGFYTAEGPDRLVFSQGAWTLIGGPDNLIKQEEVYSGYFGGVASYRIDGSRLSISTVSLPTPLVFERLPEYPMDPADLVGTKWQLASLNGGSVLAGLSITLVFDSDRHASGRAGTFVYELNYQAAGDNIRWGISGRREGDIAESLDEQAARYAGAIGLASNYRLTPDRLEIFTATGDTLVYVPLAK